MSLDTFRSKSTDTPRLRGPSVLPVRRGPVWRGPTAPCSCSATVDVRRSVTRVHGKIASTIHADRTPRPTEAVHVISIRPISAVVTGQFLYDGGELLLHHFDALLHDRVRFEVADGFHFKVESGGRGIVVEGFAVLGRFFPGRILRLRPKERSL